MSNLHSERLEIISEAPSGCRSLAALAWGCPFWNCLMFGCWGWSDRLHLIVQSKEIGKSDCFFESAVFFESVNVHPKYTQPRLMMLVWSSVLLTSSHSGRTLNITCSLKRSKRARGLKWRLLLKTVCKTVFLPKVSANQARVHKVRNSPRHSQRLLESLDVFSWIVSLGRKTGMKPQS